MGTSRSPLTPYPAPLRRGSNEGLHVATSNQTQTQTPPNTIKPMKTATAYNHLTRLKSRIDSIFSAAMSYRPTHTHILELLKGQVWDDAGLKKCPSWVRASLFNHSSSKLEEIHRHFTIWAFICPDGRPRVWEQLEEATRQGYCQADKTGNRFWLKLTNSNSHWGVVSGQTFTQIWEITADIFG